jgi:HD-like signal output (HDOD) protein
LFSFLLRKKTDPKAALKEVLSGYTLPSFPSVIMRILEQIRDPNSTAASIASVLSVDPGLLVRVLRMANSAAFSPTRKVENLSQAIAIIGLSQLESLVLSIGVSKALPNAEHPAFSPKRFWKISARRGVLAHGLAAMICPAKQSECFTAGFLQDMAIPLLVDHRPEQYGGVLKQWYDQGGDLVEMEKKAFGWHHAEVATWLCSEWGLPESIASEIGGHHHDEEGFYDCSPPVKLVSLLTEKEEDPGIEKLKETAQAQNGIPLERLEPLIETSFMKADDLSRLMS